MFSQNKFWIAHSRAGACSLLIPSLNFQAAESGNLEEFIRLYQGDNSRLTIQDGKGRTPAHQAAARNRVNILQYIREQQGSKYRGQDTIFPWQMRIMNIYGLNVRCPYIFYAFVTGMYIGFGKPSIKSRIDCLNHVKWALGKQSVVFNFKLVQTDTIAVCLHTGATSHIK